MKDRASTAVYAALCGVLGFLLIALPEPAASQNQPQTASSDHSCYGCSVDGVTTPRTPDRHPDLNGLWNDAPTGNLNPSTRQFQRASDGSVLFDFSTDFGQGDGCVSDQCQLPNQPPYKPGYIEKVKQIAETEYGASTPLDPEMQCKPYGIPRGSVGGAMQIVQTPKVIAVLYEGHPQPSSVYRVIYMDSPHPTDLIPSYLGDSRGHWEGDTLVVDVTGLNDETWLGGGVQGGGGRAKYTNIHSDQEHVVERWTRKGDDITFEATVNDPVMFSRAWVITPKRIHIDSVKDDLLLELFCTPESAGGDHIIKPNQEEKNKVCGYRCEK